MVSFPKVYVANTKAPHYSHLWIIMFLKVYEMNTESPTYRLLIQPWLDNHVPNSLRNEHIKLHVAISDTTIVMDSHIPENSHNEYSSI